MPILVHARTWAYYPCLLILEFHSIKICSEASYAPSPLCSIQLYNSCIIPIWLSALSIHVKHDYGIQATCLINIQLNITHDPAHVYLAEHTAAHLCTSIKCICFTHMWSHRTKQTTSLILYITPSYTKKNCCYYCHKICVISAGCVSTITIVV